MALPAHFTTGVIRQKPTTLVTINGVPTPADNWSTRHGTEQPIGTASLSIPVGGDISHIDLNAPIEIHAGYDGEPTRRVFWGHIVSAARSASTRGKTIRLQCEDETVRLRYTLEDDLTYNGRTQFYEIFRSLADQRNVQLFEAERVRYPNGITDVYFGGEPAVDDGNVVLKRRTSPLTWLTSKAALFGYRVFGKPGGATELQRVSGRPAASPVATFTEGVDIFEVIANRTTRSIITNWTVYGARFSDAAGVQREIRAIPGTVPFQPYVDPPGYVSGDIADSVLVTQSLVDAVRQVMEIDLSEPEEVVTWTTWGRPDIEPGDTIAITAPGAGITTGDLRWVLGVDHTRSSRGFTTTLTAWAGSGTPLPAGIDTVVIPVGTGPYRIGDEYLPHYVIPSGGGQSQVTIPFTVPATYTSLALIGRQHGTNSYLFSGVNTESTVSKLEVWQGGEKVGDAQLPMSPENLNAAHDYDNNAYWTDFRMAIPGRLDQGTAELRIVGGRDNRASSQYALDDFEIKNLAIEAAGAGRPILPGVG